MGARAAESLLGMIAGGGSGERCPIIGDTRLVVRDSCGAAQRKAFKEAV